VSLRRISRRWFARWRSGGGEKQQSAISNQLSAHHARLRRFAENR
jgi:hypothetical protein